MSVDRIIDGIEFELDSCWGCDDLGIRIDLPGYPGPHDRAGFIGDGREPEADAIAERLYLGSEIGAYVETSDDVKVEQMSCSVEVDLPSEFGLGDMVFYVADSGELVVCTPDVRPPRDGDTKPGHCPGAYQIFSEGRWWITNGPPPGDCPCGRPRAGCEYHDPTRQP